MAMLCGIFAMAIMAVAGIALPASAQSLPSDCSLAPIQDAPLVLRMPGMPDRSFPAATVRQSGTMSFDEGKEVFRTLELKMTDVVPKDIFDPVGEVEVNFLLAKGEVLDGRTYRKPAAKSGTAEYDAQDKVGGQVAFQAWSVKLPVPGGEYGNYAVDVNHVFYLASARVEFGKRDGNQLAGRIHLCVPGKQKSPFDEPPNSQIEVVGSFVATVNE